jgi:hypothetical protein
VYCEELYNKPAHNKNTHLQQEYTPSSMPNQGCARACCTVSLFSCEVSSSFLTRSMAVGEMSFQECDLK